MPYLVTDCFSTQSFIAFSWITIISFSIMAAFVLTLATFTLVKRSNRRQTVFAAAATADDFQKLVALVSLAFCCSHVVVAINFVCVLNAKDELTAMRGLFCATIATVFNSSINLFIYLAASRNFRTAFRELFVY